MGDGYGPILGPYMRAKQMALQMKALEQQEQMRKLEEERLRQQIASSQQRAAHDQTMTILDLAMKGIRPFTPQTKAPEMEAVFSPEPVLTTPLGSYRVPTPEQTQDRETKAALARAAALKRQELELGREFDPLVPLPVDPDLQSRFGASIPVPSSKVSNIYQAAVEAMRPREQVLTTRQGDAAIVSYTQSPKGPRQVGAPLMLPGLSRTGPEGPKERSLQELEVIAENDIIKSQYGGKAVIENPEWLRARDGLAAGMLQIGQATDQADAQKKAEQAMPMLTQYRGLAKEIDVRKTPEFQQRRQQRLQELLEKERPRTPPKKVTTSPEAKQKGKGLYTKERLRRFMARNKLTDEAAARAYLEKEGYEVEK